MHADSRPDSAETAGHDEPQSHAQFSVPAIPAWVAEILRSHDQMLYTTPPEPVSMSVWTGPSSFMAFEDEVAQWTTHTLTHDPQQPPTRAAALVADLAHANALLALYFTSRNAVERYLRQMDELTTSPGVSERELEVLRGGLLALAEGRAPQPAEVPRADAGPFTHTFTFSPRKSGRSEALRRARDESAPKSATPRNRPDQVPFVMLFPDHTDQAEPASREFKLCDLFDDEDLKSLPYAPDTLVCAPNNVHAVLFEQLSEKERREFAKTAVTLASLGGRELSIGEVIRNLLMIARGYGARSTA